MDWYLKHTSIGQNGKKNLVAAYEYCKKNTKKVDVFIDELSIVVTINQDLLIEEKKCTEDVLDMFDCEFVCQKKQDYCIMCMQTCDLLSKRKPHNKNPFLFYFMRLLRDWFTLHPHYDRSNFFALISASLTQKEVVPDYNIIETVKKEIYARQNCNVCDAEAVQFCAVCNLTYYCSAECQKLDWQKHKLSCFVEPNLFQHLGLAFLKKDEKGKHCQ